MDAVKQDTGQVSVQTENNQVSMKKYFSLENQATGLQL